MAGTLDKMPPKDRAAFLMAAQDRVLSVSHQPAAKSGTYVVEHTVADVFGKAFGDPDPILRFNGSGQTTYILVDRQFVTEGGGVRLSDRPKELQLSPDTERQLKSVLDGQRSPQFFTLPNHGGLVVHFAAAEVPGSNNPFRQAMADFRLQQAKFNAIVSNLQTLTLQLLGENGVIGPKTETDVYLILSDAEDLETVMVVDFGTERGFHYTFGLHPLQQQDVIEMKMNAQDVQQMERALEEWKLNPSLSQGRGWAAMELPRGHAAFQTFRDLDTLELNFNRTLKTVQAALHNFLTTMPHNPYRDVPFNPPEGF